MYHRSVGPSLPTPTPRQDLVGGGGAVRFFLDGGRRGVFVTPRLFTLRGGSGEERRGEEHVAGGDDEVVAIVTNGEASTVTVVASLLL